LGQTLNSNAKHDLKTSKWQTIPCSITSYSVGIDNIKINLLLFLPLFSVISDQLICKEKD